MEYHKPVLLTETVDGLDIKPDGVYVDVTFGGGGHSREILSRLDKEGKLIAFDQDKDALENAIDDPRFLLINENFRFLKRFLRFYGYREVDGILGDFGVSSHQFDIPERGFSTRFDSDLDMRMDQDNELSAFEVINTYEEAQLRRIFAEYGELRPAAGMARLIVEARHHQPIKTTNQLKNALGRFIPKHREHKTALGQTSHHQDHRQRSRDIAHDGFAGAVRSPERTRHHPRGSSKTRQRTRLRQKCGSEGDAW